MKSNKMRNLTKKALALLICSAMVLNNGVATFAEENQGKTPEVANTTEYQCGFEEHEHEDACYSKELLCTENAEPVLTCDVETHEHEEACYEEPALKCEKTEHKHGDNCYTAHVHEIEGCYALTCTESTEPVLVCTTEAYVHTDSCYTAHEHGEGCQTSAVTCEESTEPVLVCEKTEHEHGDACYTAHEHGDGCYTLTCEESTEPVLVCTTEEYAHTEACYEEPVLKCEKTEHVHDEEACYIVEHVHEAACYTEPVLICEKTEHTHTDECKESEPVLLMNVNEGNDSWSWDEATKTLTLKGGEVTGLSEKLPLPDGTTIVLEKDAFIAGGEESAITCDGALIIKGSGELTLTGHHGIKATSVTIEGIDVDINATSFGINVTNKNGNSSVTLKNVDGTITGGYRGISAVGAYTEGDVSVEIESCDLDLTSTTNSYSGKALNSGITVFVQDADKMECRIAIRDSKIGTIGYSAGISVNNYTNNSRSSYINITNSEVTANAVDGTWSGIFASASGKNEEADTIITIEDSSVYAVSPNTGILTSSQQGESRIILDNSILGASGKTALSMIEDSAQVKEATLQNGSTYVQMTPEAVMKGTLTIKDGNTIVATAGAGITYDEENDYYVIPQGSKVTVTDKDGKVTEYTFEKHAGGIGGFNYAKEEIWGYDVWEKWEKGDIIIYTPEELIEFATKTQDGTLGNCEGRTVKLGNDIDMTGYNWYYRNAEGTIVTDHRIPEFLGTFDGQGYTINNMTYCDEYAGTTEMTNLAFIINGRSIIKDLHINGVKVDTVAPAYFAGIVKDYAWVGSKDAYVEDCSVKNIVINADSDLSFGGMFYRLVDGCYVKNCHVENMAVNVKGTLVGDNSGRNGGFVATGGEPMTFTDCSVTNLVINAEGAAKLVGGFIGGASMTSRFYNCDVKGFELNTENKVNALGGFMAMTAGARGNGFYVENCDVTDLKISSNAKISAVGGFVGYMSGMSSLAKGAHSFVNCTAEGSIMTGDESKTGGFAGWLYGRSGGCAVKFENCKTSVNVTSENYGGAFVGDYVPYGSNKIDVVYNNCTASGDVFATEPVGSFLDANETTVDGIIGGTYNYDPENEDNGEINNVAPGYRALDNGDGTWTVFPDKGKEVVSVAFHRWNDELNGYENWRTVEVFKDVDFFEETHNNTLNFSHPEYRFANGITELDEEADDKTNDQFKYWTDSPTGTEMVLDNEVEVLKDMNVYAAYGEYACEIVETGVKYDSLAEAVADANASEGADTIRMLKSIDFDSDKALSVKGDITIIGEHTISRGAYAGTLFTVPAGSSLTLDGGLTIDGNNNWTFNDELYDYNLNNIVNVSDWNVYITPEENGTVANAAMFMVDGTVNAKDMSIKNTYSLSSGHPLFYVKGATAVLNMEGAQVVHCANKGSNTVAYMSGSKWYIKEDTAICDNFGGGNGGMCRNDYGQIYMSGGIIKDNKGHNANGSVFMMYGAGSTFEMTGGEICNNSSVVGPQNGRNAALYLHTGGTMLITGGRICHNKGCRTGGIDSYTVSALKIQRVDQDFNDPDWKDREDDAYTASNHPYIIDNISIRGYNLNDVGNAGVVDKETFKWWVTGGIYTQDVDDFCAEGYVCIPYEDSERTDDYIVVPGYRVRYHAVEKIVTIDADGNENVEYNTTLVKKEFLELLRDEFWYNQDEYAEFISYTDKDTGKIIDKWYTEKELENSYDFSNELLDNLDVYGEYNPRYGYVVIEKNLENYNATMKGSTFVYEVTAEKYGNPYYEFNEVVAIEMDGTSEKYVKVGPILEDAEVTVTEIYSGAGYTAAEPTQTQTVVYSNENETPVEIVFTGSYIPGRINYGTSVMATFKKENEN